MKEQNVDKIIEVQGRVYSHFSYMGMSMHSFNSQWLKSDIRKGLDIEENVVGTSFDECIGYAQERLTFIRNKSECIDVELEEWVGGMYAGIQAILGGVSSASLLEFIPYRKMKGLHEKYKRYSIREACEMVCRENENLRCYLSVM